jgi:hypothetical protein
MNWKELDTTSNLEKRLTDHFGKRAGERIFQDGQEAIAKIETSVQRFRAELSHLPQAD